MTDNIIPFPASHPPTDAPSEPLEPLVIRIKVEALEPPPAAPVTALGVTVAVACAVVTYLAVTALLGAS